MEEFWRQPLSSKEEDRELFEKMLNDCYKYPGSGNTFTMTFQKAGTYDYVCIIHPYMKERVIVK